MRMKSLLLLGLMVGLIVRDAIGGGSWALYSPGQNNTWCYKSYNFTHQQAVYLSYIYTKYILFIPHAVLHFNYIIYTFFLLLLAHLLTARDLLLLVLVTLHTIVIEYHGTWYG